MERFRSLGVIIDKPIPDRQKLDDLLTELRKLFEKDETTKEEVVAVMKDYLPNFDHIETGKSLDSKM